jgi:PAS domain S-box-containing protein
VFIVQDGEFVYVNEKLAEIFGYSQRELVGESPLEITGPADHDVVTDRLLEVDQDNGDTFQYCFTGVRDDETTLDVEVHGGAIEYDGDPAWIGILRNVSDGGN